MSGHLDDERLVDSLPLEVPDKNLLQVFDCVFASTKHALGQIAKKHLYFNIDDPGGLNLLEPT